MFQDEEWKAVTISELDVIIHEVLEEVRKSKNKLIGKDVIIEEE